jgi:hypothetical protein
MMSNSSQVPDHQLISQIISSQAKEGREDKDKDKVEVGAKKESDHKGSTLLESNQLETLQSTHI